MFKRAFCNFAPKQCEIFKNSKFAEISKTFTSRPVHAKLLDHAYLPELMKMNALDICPPIYHIERVDNNKSIVLFKYLDDITYVVDETSQREFIECAKNNNVDIQNDNYIVCSNDEMYCIDYELRASRNNVHRFRHIYPKIDALSLRVGSSILGFIAGPFIVYMFC